MVTLKPINSEEARKLGRQLLYRAIVILLLLPGPLAFLYLAAIPTWTWYRAQDWVTTPCTIVHSQVTENNSGEDSSAFALTIRYDYEWQGSSHSGYRYGMRDDSSPTRLPIETLRTGYPPNATRDCFVNPERPSESVLNRDFDQRALVGLYGFVPVCVYFLMLCYFRLAILIPKNSASKNAVGDECDEITLLWLDIRKLELVCSVILLLVVGLVFGNMAYTLSFFSFFGILSVLVIVFFFAVAVFYFLSMLNPTPKLRISPVHPALGGNVHVNWSFRGSTARIRKLSVVVKQHGYPALAEKNTSLLERFVLAELSDPERIAQGHATFTIPEGLVTRLESNAPFTVDIELRGEIPWRPTLKAQFHFAIARPNSNEM